MGKKDSNTSNNNKLLPTDVDEIDPDIEEVVCNVIGQKKGGRKHKFHLYRMFNLPIRTCAILAGYNKDYGYKLVAEYRKSPKIRHTIERIINDMPEAYRSVCKLRLAEVAEIEGCALREYKGNPKLAIHKPQLLKQVKQGAGVLGDDEQRSLPLININAVKNLMIKTHQRDNEGDQGQE
jgi:hypothetical protein